MELSSTRTTSSVTGGSTLTVPLLRTSTVSMMRLLLREMLLLVPLLRLSMEQPLHLLETTLLPGELLASLEDPGEEEEGGTKEVREEEEDLVELDLTHVDGLMDYNLLINSIN